MYILSILYQNQSLVFFLINFFFFNLWSHCMACRILFSWAEIQSRSPAVEAQSPNHWTTKEFPSDLVETLKQSKCLLIDEWIKKMWFIPTMEYNSGIEKNETTSFATGRGTRDHIANIRWIMEKASEFQKNIYFWFIDYAKALDCVDHRNCGKFWKRWEYQTTWPASWEICMQVRKQQLELDMEQQTRSK